ncbi:hypothetical protein V496_07441 [Pseudogymnoascus sp. VKM F-4515 (FW-2607)]|nr:hypothetical protein V496_07441 [Pseudogymnoascus sp. VKM F-4515 (FW-2607)]
MITPNDSEYLGKSRVPEILVGSLVPFSIASVTVVARFFTRAFLTRNWGADDSWVAVAWIFGTILIALNCLLTRYGSGRHQDAITEEQNQKVLLLGFITRLVYPLVLGTTKIAICALFLRIFRNDKRSRYAIYGFMAFVGSYTTSVMFTSIFQCHPINEAWQVASSAQCSNYLITLWVTAICNILCDVVLLFFIVPRILSLKIDRGQKAALLAIVSLAILVIVAAIVRLARVTQFNASSDQAWDGSDITTWSAVESSVGLICASAPPLKPLYRLLGCLTPSTVNRYSDIYATRSHTCCNQHLQDNLRGTQRCRVHMTREFGADIESTADLVAPMPVSRSYPMTVTTVRAK